MYHPAKRTRTEGGPQLAEKKRLCVAAVFLFGPFSRSYLTSKDDKNRKQCNKKCFIET